MLRFVVFSMPRTGSIMLTRQLDSHPDVTCYMALFSRKEASLAEHPATGRIYPQLSPKWRKWEERGSDPKGFLDVVDALSPDTSAVGMKQHLSGPPEATRALFDWADKVIYLTRPNHLATYSSGKLAIEFGGDRRWPGEAQARNRIAFDGEEFEKHIKNRERQDGRWRPMIEAAGGVEIHYGAARDRAAVERLWTFLGVDPKLGGDPGILKKNPEDLLSRFTNPDAVVAWLSEHDMTEFLEPEQ